MTIDNGQLTIILAGPTQQSDKLVFERLRVCGNTFPRGEGAPEGRMRNGDSFVAI